ncbi:MAG TPA: hypothetical protein VL022_01590 [Moheibacter sp.]|nr:hypothetical protein [Moheibacter sp.]
MFFVPKHELQSNVNGLGTAINRLYIIIVLSYGNPSSFAFFGTTFALEIK